MQKPQNIFHHTVGAFKKPLATNPNGTWIIILISMTVLILLISVFSWLLFFTNAGDEALITPQNVTPQQFIKQDKLKKVLDVYKEKEAMFLKLSSEPYTIADPSL